jgi:hypothetical protein
MDFCPLVMRKQLAKERRSYLPKSSLVLLVVVELLFSILCCPDMSEVLPYFGSILKGL